MYCRDCGKEIPDDSTFCPECGAAQPQSSGTAPSVVTGGHGQTTSTPEVVSPGLNIGIIVGSVFIPLIGIIMGIVYMRDANPDKKKAGKVWLWVGIGAAIFWILATSGY